MTDEFYHKNIFGTVVDINFGAAEEPSFAKATEWLVRMKDDLV